MMILTTQFVRPPLLPVKPSCSEISTKLGELTCACMHLLFSLLLGLQYVIFISSCRDKQATNSGSGPEFFGYSNPTILDLLQKIPDSRKCSKYKFVRFAEPQRRPRKGTPGSPSATKQLSALSKKRPVNKPTKETSRSQKRKSMHVPKQDIAGEMKRPEDSGLAIAPVFGGMDTVSYSSSDDASLSSEGDLIIDN